MGESQLHFFAKAVAGATTRWLPPRVACAVEGWARLWQQMDAWCRGHAKWRAETNEQQWSIRGESRESVRPPNPLRAFFEAHREGHGIWKWDHYFDIYNRHFSRFRDLEVHVLEIGIYSGGSLEMWKEYFGPRCQVYGVDIEPACKAYGRDSVKVFIGDQADRGFWGRFKREVKAVDIVIDDGGHQAEQQIVTLEELLPHIRPGGVYLCEDVHGVFNRFASYTHGLAHNLNAFEHNARDPGNNERRIVCRATALQSAVRAVHLYPYVVVIERTDEPISELVAPKRGTQWQPFLK